MAKLRTPNRRWVAEELAEAKKFYWDSLEGAKEIEVRLQVMEDGRWDLHFGPGDYDQDHRGFWGSACLSRKTNCLDMAGVLVEEVAENAAGRGGTEE